MRQIGKWIISCSAEVTLLHVEVCTWPKPHLDKSQIWPFIETPYQRLNIPFEHKWKYSLTDWKIVPTWMEVKTFYKIDPNLKKHLSKEKKRYEIYITWWEETKRNKDYSSDYSKDGNNEIHKKRGRNSKNK